MKIENMVNWAETNEPMDVPQIYTGSCDRDGRGVVIGCKIDQMPITNPFDRPDSLCFQKVCKFVEPGG